MVVGFFLLGMAGCLLNAFSWGAALMVLVLFLAVVLGRRRFYRSSFFWEEAIPAYWLGGALGMLALNMVLGCFVYFPRWNRAETWGFDQALNAPHVLLGHAGILLLVLVSWIWRVNLRRRQRRRTEGLAPVQGSRHG